MFCRKCGARNDDNANRCTSCGEMLQPFAAPGTTPGYGPDGSQGRPVDVPNYLVPAILVTVFCCLPFGIPAIVFAAQVNSKLAGGDYQGAVNASQQAKMWTWISFVCGLIPLILYVALMAAGVALQ